MPFAGFSTLSIGPGCCFLEAEHVSRSPSVALIQLVFGGVSKGHKSFPTALTSRIRPRSSPKPLSLSFRKYNAGLRFAAFRHQGHATQALYFPPVVTIT